MIRIIWICQSSLLKPKVLRRLIQHSVSSSHKRHWLRVARYPSPQKITSYVVSSVQFVDAPVSGGINAAAAGTLTFMVFFMLCQVVQVLSEQLKAFFRLVQSRKRLLLWQRCSWRTWAPRLPTSNILHSIFSCLLRSPIVVEWALVVLSRFATTCCWQSPWSAPQRLWTSASSKVQARTNVVQPSNKQTTPGLGWTPSCWLPSWARQQEGGTGG